MTLVVGGYTEAIGFRNGVDGYWGGLELECEFIPDFGFVVGGIVVLIFFNDNVLILCPT